MKDENFPHTRKPLHWRRRGVAGGSFRAMEESTAIRVQRAKQRDSHTDDQCRPALTSLRKPTGAGGGWEVRLQLQRSDLRERTGVGCVNAA